MRIACARGVTGKCKDELCSCGEVDSMSRPGSHVPLKRSDQPQAGGRRTAPIKRVHHVQPPRSILTHHEKLKKAGDRGREKGEEEKMRFRWAAWTGYKRTRNTPDPQMRIRLDRYRPLTRVSGARVAIMLVSEGRSRWCRGWRMVQEPGLGSEQSRNIVTISGRGESAETR